MMPRIFILNDLTPQQRKVLLYVAGGKTNEEIAQIMGLAVPTVKNHVARILQKLNAPNRTGGVGAAFAAGLLCVRNGRISL